MDHELEHATPPTFQTCNREVAPVTLFARAEDVLEAMLQSVQGGEQHLRPALRTSDENPAPNCLEIGFALKDCLTNKSRREYLIQRLKPHRSVLITPLPSNILQYGLIFDFIRSLIRAGQTIYDLGSGLGKVMFWRARRDEDGHWREVITTAR